MGDFFVVEIKYILTKINNSVIFCVKEVLYLGFYNMKFDTIFENVKNMFVYRPSTLIVRYADGEIVIDLTKKNISGINSQTFNKLMTPEFAVENHIDKSGLRLTTLIDKKTGKPVPAFVAGVEPDYKGTEKYVIVVEDPLGERSLNNKRYKTVGSIYFSVNPEKQMVMPKFEMAFDKNGQLCEKVLSYMIAPGNKDYSGIGTRLHQIRMERMFQSGSKGSLIIAQDESFPFHYAMGYRLYKVTTPIEKCIDTLNMLHYINGKSYQENAKYLFVEFHNNEYVINESASLEYCLCDYYKNGGKPLGFDNMFSAPNMFINDTSAQQWSNLIMRQPILLNIEPVADSKFSFLRTLFNKKRHTR